MAAKTKRKAPAKLEPAPAPASRLFEVTEHWRIVRIKSGRTVGRITTEYLSEDDAIDSDMDAAEIALARLGYRVEPDDERNKAEEKRTVDTGEKFA